MEESDMNLEERAKKLQEDVLLGTIDSLKAETESLENQLSQQKIIFQEQIEQLQACNNLLFEPTKEAELSQATEEIIQLKEELIKKNAQIKKQNQRIKLQLQEITEFINENDKLNQELMKLKTTSRK